MMSGKSTRREFVRDGALAAAGIAVGLTATYTVRAGNPDRADTSKILSYNPDMEYRRCGKTNMMISAVCLGGHWKRIERVVPGKSSFDQNRRDVVSRCLDRGINYIDACVAEEVQAYAKALKGRRDKAHLGYSWFQQEVRFPPWRSFDRLKQSLDNGLRQAGLDYVDLWRITCLEHSSEHDEATIEAVVRALEWAKRSGKARFTGISSHDRPHIKKLIEKYPQQLEVVCTPYTAKTKVVGDESGLWAAMKHLDVGWFGIKPFASNSLFKGDSSPGGAARGGRQPLGPARHSLHPLQPGDHRPHPRADYPATSGQRRPGGDGAARARPPGEGRSGAGNGAGVGDPAPPLSVAEGLGIRLIQLGEGGDEACSCVACGGGGDGGADLPCRPRRRGQGPTGKDRRRAAAVESRSRRRALPDGPPPLSVNRGAPLLLEGPAQKEAEKESEEEPAGPVADNGACFVCHANFQEEPMAVLHAKANVGCVKCHGASVAPPQRRGQRHPARHHVPGGEDRRRLCEVPRYARRRRRQGHRLLAGPLCREARSEADPLHRLPRRTPPEGPHRPLGQGDEEIARRQAAGMADAGRRQGEEGRRALPPRRRTRRFTSDSDLRQCIALELWDRTPGKLGNMGATAGLSSSVPAAIVRALLDKPAVAPYAVNPRKNVEKWS